MAFWLYGCILMQTEATFIDWRKAWKSNKYYFFPLDLLHYLLLVLSTYFQIAAVSPDICIYQTAYQIYYVILQYTNRQGPCRKMGHLTLDMEHFHCKVPYE